ncbi:class I SAM-dependent methyltransferase [Candidatus Thorarchaeota archaeon]|nr:MAG: class I SAM-dependent methyltransferase [Candidatus Thorarchaeota archaeon]
MSKRKELSDFLADEAHQPFSGWDFSYISETGRMQSEPLPWNYASIILPYVRKTQTLLDIGTGGGEFLSLIQPLPKHTCATETYGPNVVIAKKQLEPLGVHVFHVEDDMDLPFREDKFELIINRHESYEPVEVRRILEPSGHFITQQVGEQNDIDINHLLGNEPPTDRDPWNAFYASKELEDLGFIVLEQKEAFPMTRFYDVGALVYYLNAIPWVVEGFSVEKYMDALLRVHDLILANGFIEVREQRFLIVAQNKE